MLSEQEIRMDDSPYTPPESDLEKNRLLPKGFNDKNLSSRKLFIAGCISLFMIVLDIVSYFLSILSSAPTASLKNEYYAVAMLAIACSIYLLIMLKKFLHLRFRSNDADLYISILIVINLISLVLIFASSTDNQSLRSTLAIVNILALCPIGIVLILFGLKLKSLPAYPGLRFYAWSTIAAGIAYATIILFMLGFIIGILANIPLALLMFTASAEVARSAGPKDSP